MPQNETSMSPRERVQKFRESLKDRQRRRFEACVDVTVLEEMGAVAGALQTPVWRAVENALAAYCDEFHALVAERHRLQQERPRIVQCASRPHTEAFNRELQLYTERVSRLLQPRVGQTGQSVKT